MTRSTTAVRKDRAAVDASYVIPAAPKWLPKDAAAKWREVCASREPTWLRIVDRDLLANFCLLSVKVRAGWTEREVLDRKRKRSSDEEARLRQLRWLCDRQEGSLRTLATKLSLTTPSYRDASGKLVAEPEKARDARTGIGKGKELPESPPWEIAAGGTPGERVVAFIESHCVVPEGRDVGKRVVLREWQRRIVREIYDTPTRRAIVSFAKKNAKTTLSAFLTLAHLLGPMYRRNAKLYSDAQSREQAAHVFDAAAKCVRASPTLAGLVTIRDAVKQLYCPALGTLYHALSAEAKTAHGLSTPFVVHDELGQVTGARSELYEAIEASMGAYDNPLSIIISTQAATDDDLLSILIDDAKTHADPLTKLFLYEAPRDLDPFAEAAWRAANPAFGDFLNAEELRNQADAARRMPTLEASFRNQRLNQRVTRNTPFVSEIVWRENGAAPEPIAGKRVYAGLDLAATSDLCALVCVTDSDPADVVSTFWLPEEGLREKARLDRVPYDLWAEQGFLTPIPGRTVEYEYVAEHLRGLFDACDVAAVAFDRWGMNFLIPWLKRAGFTEAELARFVEFGQGWRDMAPALRELEARLLNKKLRHGNNPVLTMCAQNAIVETDGAGNRKFNKQRSTGRIDGVVSLAMAVAAMPMKAANEEAPRKYQVFSI